MNLNPEGEFEVVEDAEEFKGHSFWIDRFGTVYKVRDYGHSDWANNHMACDTDDLENKGWVHVSGYSMYCKAAILTNSQQKKMLLICEAWEYKYTQAVRDIGGLVNV